MTMKQRVARCKSPCFAVLLYILHVAGPAHSQSYSDGSKIYITDSAYHQQRWYLGENGMNISGAWKHCMTGRGVRIAFVDDPICPTHPELTHTYVGPRNTRPCLRGSPNHGMMAAGMAMNSPMGTCGVGASFGADFAIHALPLDEDMSDYTEAQALKKNIHSTDIFSNSWGPSESSLVWGTLGYHVQEALQYGINQGRNGKGAIYVWAGGNGGLNDNSCAYDGFINSRFTIAVAGVDKHGSKLRTGEACSAMFASAYSQHRSDRSGIITSSGRDGCAEDFSDSSAAAPLATGAIALMLQANPALTWRDVQHIIVRTADRDKLNARWTTNGAGYRVSPTFGFGLLNAGKMVEMARQWGSVPEQQHCVIRSTRSRRLTANRQQLTIPTYNDRCLNGMAELEHVEVHINAAYNARGHLKMALLHGRTEVTLLPGRYQDAYNSTLDWTVMAVAFWGEDPRRGVWRLRLQRAFSTLQSSGTLHSWSVHFYGTAAGARGWGENTAYNDPLHQCLLSTSTGYVPYYHEHRPARTTSSPTTTTTAPVTTPTPSTAMPPPDSGCTYRHSGSGGILASNYRWHWVNNMDECKARCKSEAASCKSVTLIPHSSDSNWYQCYKNRKQGRDDTVTRSIHNAITYDRVCGNTIPARPTRPTASSATISVTSGCTYRRSSSGGILASHYRWHWVNNMDECKAHCKSEAASCKSVTLIPHSSDSNWYQCYLNRVQGRADTVTRRMRNANTYDRVCGNTIPDNVPHYQVTVRPTRPTTSPTTIPATSDCTYRVSSTGYTLATRLYGPTWVNTMEQCASYCKSYGPNCKSITLVPNPSDSYWYGCYLNRKFSSEDTVLQSESNAITYDRICRTSTLGYVSNHQPPVRVRPIRPTPSTDSGATTTRPRFVTWMLYDY